jgi:Tol biopolymer transport system component
VIVYSSAITRKPGLSDLFAAYADGSARWRLTETDGQCESTPILTPDQLSFYFYRFPCEPADENDYEQGNYWNRRKPSFWKMGIDGSDETEVLKLDQGDSAGSAYPSPDGKTIALTGRSFSVVRVDSSGSFETAKREPVRLPGHIGFGLLPADLMWSSDGKFFVIPLATERGTALFAMDSKTLEFEQLSHPKKSSDVDRSAALSWDGRYVAFVRAEDNGSEELSSGGSLLVADLETGAERMVPVGEASPIAFTPDGSELLYKTDSTGARGYGSYSLAAGTTRLFSCSHERSTVAPDGKMALRFSPNLGEYSATLLTSDLRGTSSHEIGKVRFDDLYLGMIGPIEAWSEPDFPQYPVRYDFGNCREAS